MIRRTAIVVVFALILGAGIAVTEWLAAPAKVKDIQLASRLPASPAESIDREAIALFDHREAIAPPSLIKPSAVADNVAPVTLNMSDAVRGLGAIESSAENTPATPFDEGRVLDPSPIERRPLPGSAPSLKEPEVKAPRPAIAFVPPDAKVGSVSQAGGLPAQEKSTPPVDEPTPTPLNQTPLPASSATPGTTRLPAWLTAHVGNHDGQITTVVLQRARALYQDKVSDGQVRNSCYFAMDATRPNLLSGGEAGRRFYIICERELLFRAISAGHGSGRKLKGIADFSNGRSCVKNFGNALDSRLTAGGAYLTSETKTSFKGYYQLSAKKRALFSRTFIQYDGDGDTANARERQIGGHAAEILKNVCRQKDPKSPYADHDGYVPFGKLVDYSSGRSDGCTSWSASNARQIISIVKGNPTTLYIYPGEADVDAVTAALAKGQSLKERSLYWNKTCLKEIGSPKFWPKATLEPILAQHKKDHPASPAGPIPICKK
jgi:hypothetical protein